MTELGAIEVLDPAMFVGVKRLDVMATVIHADGSREPTRVVASRDFTSEPITDAERGVQTPMSDENYDPTAPNQHAQLLFDSWEPQDALPALYDWLSRRNVDANRAPHAGIRARIERDAAGIEGGVDEFGIETAPVLPDAFALAALGRTPEG